MADAQTPVLTDDEIAAAVAPIYGNRVAATMGLSDDIRTARLIERAVLDKIAAQAPVQPGRAVMQQAQVDALINASREADEGPSDLVRRVWAAAIAALSATMEVPNGN